jgi:hypothetical protein
MSIPKIESVNPPSALPVEVHHGLRPVMPSGAGALHDVRQGGQISPDSYASNPASPGTGEKSPQRP